MINTEQIHFPNGNILTRQVTMVGIVLCSEDNNGTLERWGIIIGRRRKTHNQDKGTCFAS